MHDTEDSLLDMYAQTPSYEHSVDGDSTKLYDGQSTNGAQIWLLSYRTLHQQGESSSLRSSELHKDKASQYSGATRNSRFIFYQNLSS